MSSEANLSDSGAESEASDGDPEAGLVEIEQRADVVEIEFEQSSYQPVAHVDLDYEWCSGMKGPAWRKIAR